MSKITTVGLDLAKNVFQVHGADSAGRAVLRKKLRRDQVLAFFSQVAPCVVAMEVCGGAHLRGRKIGKLGHEVRLIPPSYVKPFVKRQKNDMVDAEAICEAALRPTMRFVPVKSEETQGAASVFRVRELLVRQRTQAINALRGHLTEFGQTAPKGAANVCRLVAIIEDPSNGLPEQAVTILRVLVEVIRGFDTRIAKLDAEIRHRAVENELARRLMTIPGIGPSIATAITVPPRIGIDERLAKTPYPRVITVGPQIGMGREIDARDVGRLFPGHAKVIAIPTEYRPFISGRAYHADGLDHLVG